MKILVPIDDSEFSKAAVESVIKQVQPNDTEIHVLHVWSEYRGSASAKRRQVKLP